MVRIIKDQAITQDNHYIEAAGLSTDTKPGGVITGSLFLEVDTGDVFAYDEAGTQWNKIAALGGGA